MQKILHSKRKTECEEGIPDTKLAMISKAPGKVGLRVVICRIVRLISNSQSKTKS